MDLRTKFISAAIAAALSFVVSILVTLYSERSPELTYELSLSKLVKNKEKIRNIINYRIDNVGRKEAEKVEIAFKYRNGIIVKDFSVSLSSEVIEYEIVNNKENLIKAVLPLLNPTESITFSFTTLNDEGYIDIGLRAKGEVGKEKDRRNIERKEARFLILYGIIISSFTMGMVFLLLYFIGPPEEEKSNIANAADTKNHAAD